MGVEEALALEEAVDTANLQLETAQLLLQLHVGLLRLDASHLEGDEMLLRVLLRLDDALLEAAAVPIDPVPKADLHLLKLVKHDVEVGIHGLIRADATGVVQGVWLHRLTILIPDC
jgi:hypothetical protein